MRVFVCNRVLNVYTNMHAEHEILLCSNICWFIATIVFSFIQKSFYLWLFVAPTPTEPTKGLFREPPDCVVLPKQQVAVPSTRKISTATTTNSEEVEATTNSKQDNEGVVAASSSSSHLDGSPALDEDNSSTCVKCVCYSRNGKVRKVDDTMAMRVFACLCLRVFVCVSEAKSNKIFLSPA